MNATERIRFSLVRLIASPRSPLYHPRVVQLLLPRDFNEDAYLYLHADVQGSSMSGSQHFVLHGRAEGRNYCQVFSETPLLMNPIAGVNLTEYHVAQNLKDHDSPLSHFLLAGQPTGSWTLPRVHRRKVGPVTIHPFTVVHFHCFHFELLEEFLGFAENVAVEDTNQLVVTHSDPAISAQISRRLDEIEGNHQTVLVENKGRNFGALLELLDSREFAHIDLWAHFHSKASAHLPAALSRQWRQFMYRSMFGDEAGRAAFDDIAFELFMHEDLGIVYPDDPHEFGWGDNCDIASQMSIALGFEFDETPPKFPVGAMFFGRRAFLEALFHRTAKFTSAVAEPLEKDGTAWHAFERFLGVAPNHLGFRFSTVRGEATSYAWLRSS